MTYNSPSLHDLPAHGASKNYRSSETNFEGEGETLTLYVLSYNAHGAVLYDDVAMGIVSDWMELNQTTAKL